MHIFYTLRVQQFKYNGVNYTLYINVDQKY